MPDKHTGQPDANTTAPAEPAGQAQALRVVLVADETTLRRYGPVLGRLTVGLLDEVGELNLLCLGRCPSARQLPCPPIRLITETRRRHSIFERLEAGAAGRVNVAAPVLPFLDTLWPAHRIARLAAALAAHKPTLLHVLHSRHAKIVRRISKVLNVPYVVTDLGFGLPQLNLSRQRCGAVICCDSHAAVQLQHQQPDFADRVHVVGFGSLVTDEPCCFTHGRQRPSLLCCAPLEHGRGLSYLLNALKRLHLQGLGVELTISGEGSEERTLRRQCRQLDLQPFVHFVPAIRSFLNDRNAMRQILHADDIFVQPWPMTRWRPELLEAMAVGNAVVAAEGLGNDLLKPDENAVLVPFEDEHPLADALADLIQHPYRGRRLAEQGQQHLREHFLPSQMVVRTAAAYHQALTCTAKA